MKNLRIFSSLCGQMAMPNVVIVTTMWRNIPEELGIRREEELKKDVWKDMVAGGCRTERFQDTHESAWGIIGSLADKAPIQVQLSKEIVDGGLNIKETIAGISAYHERETQPDRIVV